MTKLIYFSWIRERLDRTEEEVALPENVRSVGDLIDWQKTRGEAFSSVFEHDRLVRVALDREHAADRSAAIDGVSEIAFFPPMTGG